MAPALSSDDRELIRLIAREVAEEVVVPIIDDIIDERIKTHTAICPIGRSINNWRQRGIGVIAVCSFFAAGIGAIFGTSVKWIHGLLDK
jgi:hypothetical protein